MTPMIRSIRFGPMPAPGPTPPESGLLLVTKG